MATHLLKTWPEYFTAILKGEKTFEFRRNDRDFRPDDTVVLQLFDPLTGYILGHQNEPNELTFRIGYVLKGPMTGLAAGFCIFSLIPI